MNVFKAEYLGWKGKYVKYFLKLFCSMLPPMFHFTPFHDTHHDLFQKTKITPGNRPTGNFEAFPALGFGQKML
jgi:hypothetical protein